MKIPIRTSLRRPLGRKGYVNDVNDVSSLFVSELAIYIGSPGLQALTTLPVRRKSATLALPWHPGKAVQ
jgi:hypothetical protein